MKLTKLRLCNFQSFGPEAASVTFENLTFLIGPNGSGKTAALQGLCRLFSFDPKHRRILQSDFHVPNDPASGRAPTERSLWIEAEFEFAELRDEANEFATVPPNFAHMRLESASGVPVVRFRLSATLDVDGEVEENLSYVLEVDSAGKVTKESRVPKQDRNSIHVHYLPARRDPTDHISYATSSLLGRMMRSINWSKTQEGVADLAEKISEQLSANPAVEKVGEELASFWKELHAGKYYSEPEVSFLKNEMDALLRHLSVGFSPGHSDESVDFSRLSDGQKSLLYLSLVLAVQGIGRKVLAGKHDSFVVERLRPAFFTFIAMEEPENSLSPHYLGRIVKTLSDFSIHHDSQAAIATHAPSLLKRINPIAIRYLRLNSDRVSTVKTIVMPNAADEAHKFVKEAVEAFPEIYFSRLVLLGEGTSEEIVLPRLMKAQGLGVDLASVTIAPLGGRHVNHFWRLLRTLEIPFVTLLDFDLARYQGGWGRIRYVIGQLLKFPPPASDLNESHLEVPSWDEITQFAKSKTGPGWIDYLEKAGVFFSSPLDLDFAMIKAFPTAYKLDATELETPDAETIASVLGKKNSGIGQYEPANQKFFSAYCKRFKQGSKPAAHLGAMGDLTDEEIKKNIPEVIKRLIALAGKLLEETHE